MTVQIKSNDKIQKFAFPSNINEPTFENRRVIFMALTGKETGKERQDVYEKFKTSGETGLEDDVKGIVTLPLNENISDSQGHKWAESDYVSAIGGGIDAALGSLGGMFKKSNWFFGEKGLVNDLRKVVKGGYEAINGAPAAAIADYMGVRRPMINPGQFQYYQGSSLRSFKFSFTFIPENQKETQQVIEIIRFFKKCASPSLPFSDSKEIKEEKGLWGTLTSQGIMLSPCTWEIFVCNPTINKLMSFHKCACTNVSVTYGDSEKVSMYYDGMPKQVSLSLDFAECQLQFSESYGDSDIYTNKLDADLTDKAIEATSEAMVNAGTAMDNWASQPLGVSDFLNPATLVAKGLVKGGSLIGSQWQKYDVPGMIKGWLP